MDGDDLNPEVIYFLTDGDLTYDLNSVLTFANYASKNHIQINCISMMQPTAIEVLKQLSFHTEGDFSMVLPDGSIEPMSAW